MTWLHLSHWLKRHIIGDKKKLLGLRKIMARVMYLCDISSENHL